MKCIVNTGTKVDIYLVCLLVIRWPSGSRSSGQSVRGACLGHLH